MSGNIVPEVLKARIQYLMKLLYKTFSQIFIAVRIYYIQYLLKIGLFVRVLILSILLGSNEIFFNLFSKWLYLYDIHFTITRHLLKAYNVVIDFHAL